MAGRPLRRARLNGNAADQLWSLLLRSKHKNFRDALSSGQIIISGSGRPFYLEEDSVRQSGHLFDYVRDALSNHSPAFVVDFSDDGDVVVWANPSRSLPALANPSSWWLISEACPDGATTIKVVEASSEADAERHVSGYANAWEVRPATKKEVAEYKGKPKTNWIRTERWR